MTPPRLSVEELAELERLADDSANAIRNKKMTHEETMVLASQFKYALLDAAPALLAMATELVRLESAREFLVAWGDKRQMGFALGHDDELLSEAYERGWRDPTTPKAGG